MIYMFEDEDIKNQLKDYKRVKNFDKIEQWSQIKYVTVLEDGSKEFKMGGLLKRKFDDYIVLQSGETSWSVRKENNIFFVKTNVNEKKLKQMIEENNDRLKNLGGDSVCFTNDIDSNNDIFNNLRKPKGLTNKMIKAIKEKFSLHGWKYLLPHEIESIDVIRYVDLKCQTLSREAHVLDININKKTGIVENIKLTDSENKFKWTIKPHKHYIFKDPDSAYKALFNNKSIIEKLKKSKLK